MPRIPSYQKQVLPSTNVGAAPLSPSAADVNGGAIGQGLQALGGGISDVGQAMFRIEQKKQQMRDEASIAQASAMENDYEISEVDRINSTNYASVKDIQNDRQNSVKGLQSIREQQKGLMSNEAYAQYSNWSKVNETRRSRNISGAYYKKEVELGKSTASITLGNAYQTLYNPSATPDQRVLAEDNIEKIKAGYSPYFEPFMLESTASTAEYQAIIDNGGTKEMAQQAIDRSASEGRITPEQKKKLYGNISDYYRNANLQKQQDIIQTSTSFAKELANGTFNGDDIALSNLPVSVKKDWEVIAENAKKTAPTNSTLVGSEIVSKALTDYASGKIGKIDAINDIVNARYKDELITDNYYKFAINRIENPYPDHIAKTITGAMEAAKTVVYHEGIGFFGKDWIDRKEKQKLVDVQTGLLSWIEEESKGGTYPTGEAIYTKVRELGISVKSPNADTTQIVIPIPDKSDITYDPNESDFEKLESGTRWYDPATKQWWIKK